MVQNKETDGKVLTNGEIKLEENGTTPQSEKTNGFASDSEESDDDDYLDHLLMLPRLDVYSSDRNRHLVSKTLLDFCTAIENHKGYQKIKQELLVNCPQDECKQEPIEPHEEETPILNGTESPPLPAETSTAIEVSEEVAEVAEEDVVPEIRRQSIRLKKAQFVPEHAPAINDQFFVCRRCTIFFRTRKLRKLHNITHHRRKLNGQVVAVDKAKQRLRRSLSNKEPFICDLCEKNFKQKALLRSHMNTHMTEPQFFCSLCPYASKRNNDLKKHHETHHNPDRVVKQRVRKRKCEKCDDVLDGKKAFKKHMREKHPPEKSLKKGRFKKSCTECEEILDGIKAFRVHMKQKHSATTDIRCETCHRKFKSNFRLKKHKAKYGESNIDCRTYFRPNGENSIFNCEHCEKKFTLKSHLSLHMKKHSNLTCGKCSMTFKNKFNLKWHEFSHLEIEPKCTNCSVNFTSEQKFSVHLKKKICISNGIVNGAAV